MKLTNVLVDGEKRLAQIADGEVYLLDTGLTMEDVIKRGNCGELAKTGREKISDPVYANLVEAEKIICVGLNYPKHTAGIRMKDPDYPVLFSKFRDSLVPHNRDIIIREGEDTYDYEGELVVVMGKRCYRVSKEEAMDYVFGYSIGNDVTCRDVQLRTGQWLAGKAMPTFGPLGPCIVTRDEYQPGNKVIRSYVNGVLKQEGNTDEMIFSIADIIEYTARYIPLNPGDLIYTGTPSGVAYEFDSGYLKEEDVIDIEIEGIGTLTNTVHLKA